MIAFGEDDNLRNAPFLIKSIEESDNEIHYIVELSYEGKNETDIDDTGIPKLNDILKKATPIYPDNNEAYEIIFESYVFHITRNESYTSYDEYEISKGRFFLEFQRSRLLDSIPLIVEPELVKAFYPNGWKHYGIYCQNHIIDVIAASEPIIKKIVISE